MVGGSDSIYEWFDFGGEVKERNKL